MRCSRRTSNKIRIFIVKAITAIMAMIFICVMCSTPDSDLRWVAGLMIISGGWLTLVGYVNGWMIDTKPWYERQKRENHDMY